MKPAAPIFVKHLLAHEQPAWCCLHTGFSITSIIFSRFSSRISNGDDEKEVCDELLRLHATVNAALLKEDKEGLCRVILEILSDGIQEQLIDQSPQEVLEQYMAVIKSETKTIKGE